MRMRRNPEMSPHSAAATTDIGAPISPRGNMAGPPHFAAAGPGAVRQRSRY